MPLAPRSLQPFRALGVSALDEPSGQDRDRLDLHQELFPDQPGDD
jgi:hypothetical protein